MLGEPIWRLTSVSDVYNYQMPNVRSINIRWNFFNILYLSDSLNNSCASRSSNPVLIQENFDEVEGVSDYLTSDEDPIELILDYYYPIIDNSINQLDLFDKTNYNKEVNKVVGL